MGLGTLDKGGILGDVGIGGATASADDVDQSLGDVLLHLHGHLNRCLVIAAEAVGESRIGVARDVVGGTCGKALEVGLHLCGTERAVQSHREDIGMAHRGEERVEGLSREGAPSGIGDGHREHDGQALAHALHHAFGSIDGRLGIERVEDGLDEQRIHAALDEGLHLFVIGFHQFIVGDATQGWVVHVGADGAGLVGGAHRTCHEAGLLGCAHSIGLAACDGSCGKVDLAAQVFAAIVGHRDALRIERAGLNDVDTHAQVAAVYVGNHVGTCEAEQVVVALLQSRQGGKALATEVSFSESEALYHRTHGAIQDEDALLDNIV